MTETDQEVERMIKEMIKQNYPDHFFVGEETSEETGGRCFVTILIEGSQETKRVPNVNRKPQNCSILCFVDVSLSIE